MRVVFVGSPPFGTPILERLASSDFRPALVVTPPGRAKGRGRRVGSQPLAERARELGLNLAQPASVRDPDFFAQLQELAPDVILVASYGEFLRKEFLELPRLAALNVHPSLLPRHRGATPVPAALLAGDETTGITIQRIALELDAGDVLVACETPIAEGETAGELLERLAELSGGLCLEALELLAKGEAHFTPQDPAGVTFCKKLEKDDGLLDWSLPARVLARNVRAYNPWPGAATTLPDERRLSIWRAHPVPWDEQAVPGTLVEAEGALVVATGEGALELEEVQVAGKRALPAADFQRGARLAPGTVLGAKEGA